MTLYLIKFENHTKNVVDYDLRVRTKREAQKYIRLMLKLDLIPKKTIYHRKNRTNFKYNNMSLSLTIISAKHKERAAKINLQKINQKIMLATQKQ